MLLPEMLVNFKLLNYMENEI